MTATRRGYSLIEMLAVIACISMLIGLGVTTLEALFRIERTIRAGRDDDRAVNGLMTTFRADVHSAVGHGEAAAEALVLNLPGGSTAEYRIDGSTVEVIRRRGGEPRQSERFRLRSPGSPRLALERRDGRAFARLMLPRVREEGWLNVEATLGLLEPADEEERP